MAAYLGYTLRMRTLFRGWPIMVNNTHTRRRRSSHFVCLELSVKSQWSNPSECGDHEFSTIFTVQHICTVQTMLWQDVCQSVRQMPIFTQKLMAVWSHSFHHPVAQGFCSFFDTNFPILGLTGTLFVRASNEIVVGKNDKKAKFQPVKHYV